MVARKSAKYKLDLMVVQEVIWDGGGSHPENDYNCFYDNGNANQHT
jgi:hypothetical protein